MEDNKCEKKIKTGRNLIIIPLLITGICGWLDIWTNITSGAFCGYSWIEITTSIIRCAMGYLFPSLLSLVITMVWQQVTTEEDSPYGVEPGKIGIAVICTVLYSTVFITCLIKYNIHTAITLLVVTLAYIIWSYCVCLDKRLKIKSKNDMNEDELLQAHIKKYNKKRRKTK